MALGARGETVAAEFLTARGYRIVSRNFRCPQGEIDIVAVDHDTLVFVEVKTRRSDVAADPEVNVHRQKRRRMVRAASAYVGRKGLEDYPLRFDVMAIVLAEAGEPRIEHFEDAFPAEGQ
jgi:putative endonuclease